MKRGILLVATGLVMGIGAGAYLYNAAAFRDSAGGATPDGGSGCVGCHEELVGHWRRSGHRTVGCEACHGPAGRHTVEAIDPRPKLPIKGPGICLECHLREEYEDGTTSWRECLERHLKAVERKHVTTIDRARVAERCVFCHEPHSLE